MNNEKLNVTTWRVYGVPKVKKYNVFLPFCIGGNFVKFGSMPTGTQAIEKIRTRT